MKRSELLKKSNPQGDDMKLSKEFDRLRKKDHSQSLEQLDSWLDHNSQKEKTMKSIYKIAASLMIGTLLFIACSIPVQHEEKIGYMIKGLASAEDFKTNTKLKLSELGIDPLQVSVQRVLHEEESGEAKELNEIVMVLPEANYDLAEERQAALSEVFKFQSIEIYPIEDKVERTFFESVLHKFELKEKELEISDEHFKAKIGAFLREHTESLSGDVEIEIKVDEKGTRFVEIPLETVTGKKANVTIEYIDGGNAINYQSTKDQEEKLNEAN